MKHGDMETSNGKLKIEAKKIFPNLFTVCSLFKLNFVICLFVNKEKKKKNYPFANGLNGLNRLRTRPSMVILHNIKMLRHDCI